MTAVTGSPFAGNGAYIAGSRGWLFSTDTVDIYSYSIAADGALKQMSSINAQQYNQYPTGGPINLFLDRTGSTLYDEDIYWDGANNNYQSFDLSHGQALSPILAQRPPTAPRGSLPSASSATTWTGTERLA